MAASISYSGSMGGSSGIMNARSTDMSAMSGGSTTIHRTPSRERRRPGGGAGVVPTSVVAAPSPTGGDRRKKSGGAVAVAASPRRQQQKSPTHHHNHQHHNRPSSSPKASTEAIMTAAHHSRDTVVRRQSPSSREGRVGGAGVGGVEAEKKRSPAEAAAAAAKELEQLRTQLSRSARMNDKRNALKLLRAPSTTRKFFRCIVVETVPPSVAHSLTSNQLAFLEDEVAKCTNGTAVNGTNFVENPGGTRRDSVVQIMKELCDELCGELLRDQVRRGELYDGDVESTSSLLYRSLLVRLAPTAAASDARRVVDEMLACPPDITVASSASQYQQQRARMERAQKKAASVVGAASGLAFSANPGAQLPPVPPTDLVLYQSEGALHAVVSSHHPLGLFRKSDIEQSAAGGNSAAASLAKPWINLIATVKERVNLSANVGSRQISVRIIEPKSKYDVVGAAAASASAAGQ